MSKSPIHRHLPFLLGFVAGVALSIILLLVHPTAALVGGAITFFLIYLVHTAARIPYLTAAYLKTNAARADEPAWIIFAITFGTIVVAVASLFIVLNQSKAQDPAAADAVARHGRAGVVHHPHHDGAPLRASLLAAGRTENAKDKRHGGLEFPGGHRARRL